MPNLKPDAVVLSECGRYRYLNHFRLGRDPRVGTFILLNPSSGDPNYGGPTQARYLKVAEREGFGQILIVNLFGYITEKPEQLRALADPFGPDNPRYQHHAIWLAHYSGGAIICAWGAGGAYRRAGKRVLAYLGRYKLPAHALCLTRAGYPHHPLRAPIGDRLIRLGEGE